MGWSFHRRVDPRAIISVPAAVDKAAPPALNPPGMGSVRPGQVHWKRRSRLHADEVYDETLSSGNDGGPAADDPDRGQE